jgi:hypothetical protein
MYFGRDPNWYLDTPGDFWYQPPRDIGDDTAYHVYSTDLYKLIAFVQWSIRVAQVFDCEFKQLDVGSLYPLPDYRGSGFQTINRKIFNVVQTGDLTQPGGILSFRNGGTFYGYAGTPCDNQQTDFYHSTWTFAEGTGWDDYPTHQHKYDLDNNRYKDDQAVYSHADMPWDPLVDQA